MFSAMKIAYSSGHKNKSHLQMSHVTRKPVFDVCDQVRLKPACSADESS